MKVIFIENKMKSGEKLLSIQTTKNVSKGVSLMEVMQNIESLPLD